MLIKITDECLTNMDDGKATICTFVDIKKAFDCISHPILFKKLHAMGIQVSWKIEYKGLKWEIAPPVPRHVN